jgi:hypothetical protein
MGNRFPKSVSGAPFTRPGLALSSSFFAPPFLSAILPFGLARTNRGTFQTHKVIAWKGLCEELAESPENE